MNKERSRKNKEMKYFIIGIFVVLSSTIISIIVMPFFINSRISNLDYMMKDLEMEMEISQRSFENRDKIKLQSLILRAELDILQSNSADSLEVVSERQSEVLELEMLALIEIAKNVFDDFELVEQEERWASMDYNQLQMEQQIILEKLDDLGALYSELIIANEQKYTEILNYKEILFYLIPALIITGTLIGHYSTYLGKKEKVEREISPLG